MLYVKRTFLRHKNLSIRNKYGYSTFVLLFKKTYFIKKSCKYSNIKLAIAFKTMNDLDMYFQANP